MSGTPQPENPTPPPDLPRPLPELPRLDPLEEPDEDAPADRPPSPEDVPYVPPPGTQ